jgi:hypothetical protein
MKNLLHYIPFVLMVGGAFAQINNNGQQIWILSVSLMTYWPYMIALARL